ncbi:hypothetical protein E3U43_019302, partial [Larimichthys crocea]
MGQKKVVQGRERTEAGSAGWGAGCKLHSPLRSRGGAGTGRRHGGEPVREDQRGRAPSLPRRHGAGCGNVGLADNGRVTW